MLRTLFSYWRLDSMSLKQGSIAGVLQAFALNQISRLIGFVVRSMVLFTWFVAQLVIIFFAVGFYILFLAWPLLVVVAFATGIVYLAV